MIKTKALGVLDGNYISHCPRCKTLYLGINMLCNCIEIGKITQQIAFHTNELGDSIPLQRELQIEEQEDKVE